MSAGPGDALGECERPLAEAFDGALYDLDGVLYVGSAAVPHAAAAVGAARQAGLRAAFVTNNASRRPAAVAAHLTRLGVPAAETDVVTSAQAAVHLLRERLGAGAAVLVVGSDDLAEEVADGGLVPVRSAGDSASGRPAGVIQGLARTTSWADLAEACLAIRAGALWVAGNADTTYPTPRGLVLGNGAVVEALATATGQRPVVVGKPELRLHQEAVGRLGAARPLVVGDRLDTDILGAVRAGTPSLLVLTGVTSREELLEAPPGMRPSFVAEDLRALLEPQPPVAAEEGRMRCGSATARWDAGEVVTDGPPTEALRAACALSWAARDRT